MCVRKMREGTFWKSRRERDLNEKGGERGHYRKKESIEIQTKREREWEISRDKKREKEKDIYRKGKQ